MDQGTLLCEHCGEPFKPANVRRPSRFCKSKCRSAAWWAAKAGPEQTRTFACETCGKSVTVVVDGRTNRRRFCKTTCQVKAWAKENPERFAELKAEALRREADAVAVDKPDCPYCDEKIGPGRSLLCGKPDCKRKHHAASLREMRAEYKRVHGRSYRAATHAKSLRKRKALAKNAPWEDFEDREIYERDGWVCQIGFHPIDPAAQHPAPGCATIDHILPRSYGGGHTRGNVRTACLFHNMSRGNKVSDEDLALIGMRREGLVLVA